MRAEVNGFDLAGGRIETVRTDRGNIRPRAVVIASGMWSRSLAKALGHRVPMESQRGYHVTIAEPGTGRALPVDTGFMVYNEVTYPNLTRLFAEIGAPTTDTSMSFSVQHRPTGLEWCGSGMDGLFAQRSNLFRPSHWRFLGDPMVHHFTPAWF